MLVVEFRHGTHNVSKIRRIRGTECLKTRFPLLTLIYTQYRIRIFFGDLKKCNIIEIELAY